MIYEIAQFIYLSCTKLRKHRNICKIFHNFLHWIYQKNTFSYKLHSVTPPPAYNKAQLFNTILSLATNFTPECLYMDGNSSPVYQEQHLSANFILTHPIGREHTSLLQINNKNPSHLLIISIGINTPYINRQNNRHVC